MGKSKRRTIATIVVYTILIMTGIVYMVPLIWLLRSSFMQLGQIFNMPPEWIPKPFTLQNYVEVFKVAPFLTYIKNSFVIVIIVVVGNVITSSLCAYSFSRINWKGRDLVFSILMSSLMLPVYVTLIPTFIGWSALGQTNSIVPLTVPAWFGGGVFFVFLLRQFFRSIPREIDESAYIDGASHFAIYTRIILPLSKPSLIVVGLFSFLWTWKDFMNPLIYLNSDDKFTVALGLQQFVSLYSAQWQLLMAAAMIALIPVLIIFFVGQKYFVEGIATTGLKG